MTLVEAGARRDMGQFDAALRTLELAPLNCKSRAAWVVRLRYAYADTLEAAGRETRRARRGSTAPRRSTASRSPTPPTRAEELEKRRLSCWSNGAADRTDRGRSAPPGAPLQPLAVRRSRTRLDDRDRAVCVARRTSEHDGVARPERRTLRVDQARRRTCSGSVVSDSDAVPAQVRRPRRPGRSPSIVHLHAGQVQRARRSRPVAGEDTPTVDRLRRRLPITSTWLFERRQRAGAVHEPDPSADARQRDAMTRSRPPRPLRPGAPPAAVWDCRSPGRPRA